MTRRELAKKIAERGNCSALQAYDILGDFIICAGDALAAGEMVFLKGFGTFRIVEREKKIGFLDSDNHPKGSWHKFRAVKFKKGRFLKEMIK